MKQVFSIFEKYLKDGDAAIIGVSGGPDSMALLSMLIRWQKQSKKNIRFVAAHVNHGLRGKASDLDEALVKNAAKKNKLAFESKKINLNGKSNIEARGREERRSFFQNMRKKYNAGWIITAHHEDDNIESIVLHFLRGSGPSGLSGMRIAKDCYFRPLLEIPKKNLLNHCRKNRVAFRLDKTNNDNAFRRNLLRNKIFPLFKKINPSFKKTIKNNAEIFQDVDEWLKEQAFRFLEQQNVKGLFHRKDFQKLQKAVQKTVIQTAFQAKTKQPYRLQSVKIKEIMRLIGKNIGKKKIVTGKYGAFSLDKGIVDFK